MYTFVFYLDGATQRVKGDHLRVSETGAIIIIKDNKIIAAVPQGVYVVAEEAEVN